MVMIVIAMATVNFKGALNAELFDILHSVVQSLGELVDGHHLVLSKLQLHMALEQLQVRLTQNINIKCL